MAFGWGVDGFGRQHICTRYGTEVILCVLPGCSVYECIDLLEMKGGEIY